MNRKALSLGLFSIGGQALLIREIMATLNGDEIFIGISLFGWMMAVAFGALLGKMFRSIRSIRSSSVLITGVFILPLSIVLIRLAPIVYSSTPGSYIPFYYSIISAIICLMPVGLISGLGFTLISYEGHRPAASIARVYLFEGIGAFGGGLLIRLLVGSVISGLAMSLALGVLTIFIIYIKSVSFRNLYFVVFGLALIFAGILKAPIFDRQIASLKFPGYNVIESFDTRYSRQTILTRENQTTLITNNQVEAVFPDIESNEYLLLPGLAYLDSIGNVKALYVGRPEFGLSGVADKLENISLDCYDPRIKLTGKSRLGNSSKTNLIETDLLSTLNSGNHYLTHYDIISLSISSFDSYESSRYLIFENILSLKNLLSEQGILQVTIDIDTDRHISQGKEILLSVIYERFGDCFSNSIFWPGQKTLFLFSDNTDFSVEYRELVTRLNRFSYQPQYVNDYYMFDKFDPLKISRLQETLDKSAPSSTNSIVLHYQMMLTLTMNKIDIYLYSILFQPNYSPIILAAIILLIFISMFLTRYRRRKFSLFLYFVAGYVSISFELLSFYLYQTQKGILFSDISILISIFMIGMAVGTYYSGRLNKENLEFPSLLLMLSAGFIFYMTYNLIDHNLLLLYHSSFLFVIAMATGSLFVAATDRYYFGRSQANRGIGYAFEIGGSALGALTATTLLLPIIGLPMLNISIIVLIVVTLAGALLTVNK